MKSQKTNRLAKVMKKSVSLATGSMLLFSALILSVDSMPSHTNEDESVFFKMLSTNLQRIEVEETAKNDFEDFRVKVLTKRLEKKKKRKKKLNY